MKAPRKPFTKEQEERIAEILKDLFTDRLLDIEEKIQGEVLTATRQESELDRLELKRRIEALEVGRIALGDKGLDRIDELELELERQTMGPPTVHADERDRATTRIEGCYLAMAVQNARFNSILEDIVEELDRIAGTPSSPGADAGIPQPEVPGGELAALEGSIQHYEYLINKAAQALTRIREL